MDFHSLTRKELQTLCKQNKIPANMTNVAMADSLAALQFVEGLDGLRNQCQWPEKTVATESPLIPRTAYRTSTRKKSIKEDPDTVQPMTKTCRTARKPLDKDLGQKNQNANVAETPAVPVSSRRAPAASASKKMGTQVKDNMEKEMSCGVKTETPMAQTGRGRVAQVGSTRRKLEESVQRVYSTRRSVRLLEKTLVDLSLKDVAKEESVKMVSLDETEEKDGSEVSLEKSNDSEVSLGVSFLKSLENESQLKEIHEDEKSNEHEKENINMSTQDFVNSDNVSVVDGKDDNRDETCDASNELSAENSNAIKSVDIPGIEFISETENASIKVIEPEESLATETSDEISAQMVEDVVYEDQIITSQKNSEVDSDQFVANSIASPLKKQVAVECVVPVHLDNFVATCNSESRNIRIDDEFGLDKAVVTNVSIANSIAPPLKMQVAVECAEKESVYSDKVGATHCSDGPNAETDNAFVSDNRTHSSDNPTAETDEFDSDNVVDDPNSETDEEFDSDNVVAHSSDDSNDETNEFDSDEELVDVHLTKAEVPISSVKGPEDLIETEVPISDDIDTEGTEETDPNSETDDELDSDDVVTHSSDDSNDEFDSDDELLDVQLTKAEVPISSVKGPEDLIETEVPISDDIDTEGTEETDPNSETDEELDSDNVVTHSSDDSNDEFDSDDELLDVQLTKAEVPISSVKGPEDFIETEVPISDDIDTEGTEETDPNSKTDEELDSDNVVTHSSDDSDDELVDVQLTEAEIPISSVEGPDDANLIEAEVPTSDDTDTEGTEEAEFFCENKTQKSVKQMNSSLPIDSVSGDKTPGYHPMSPLGADSISGQFPRPTQSTPKQTSSKKQATSEKLTLPAYINENIDISVMQLGSKMENVKKDKRTTDVDNLQKSLSKKSLRELNKMLKEKLQITNKKNNEDHNATNRRPALLENVMAPADPTEIN